MSDNPWNCVLAPTMDRSKSARREENDRSRVFSLVVEWICERNTQRLGNEAQVQDGDVPLASFDGADKSAVQAARFSQLSLGQATGYSQLPDSEAHVLQKLSVVDVHT
jgi:hypothetical protein